MSNPSRRGKVPSPKKPQPDFMAQMRELSEEAQARADADTILVILQEMRDKIDRQGRDIDGIMQDVVRFRLNGQM
ncbi:MAG: hypothetical protein AAFY56_21025 [Pseudomonadota bacterium]